MIIKDASFLLKLKQNLMESAKSKLEKERERRKKRKELQKLKKSGVVFC